ncbi:MAG: hypothetical protein KY467_07690 [Gemmatimonadetes bacterium]|nr:hypothetical protein [Gemmatimonadota bacterium]
MDLPGEEWPYHLINVLVVCGIAVLCAFAWRWAGTEKPVRAQWRGLFFWWTAAVVLVLAREPFLMFVARQGLTLPGADWKHVPAPADPVELVFFVLLGGGYSALLLGVILAAPTATARTLARGAARRWRHA